MLWTAIRRTALSIFLAIGLTLLVGPRSANAQARRKIAVYPFDEQLVGTRGLNIGEKVADGIISKIAGDGMFDVVDRQYLARIISEQNLKMNARFDPESAAKLGKLANIDVLIVGQIDAFHANASSAQANGFFSNKTTVTGEVDLKVTARLINVETASIMAAPAASSELTKTLSEKKDYLPSNQGSLTSKTTGTGDVRSALLKLVDQSVEDVSADLSKKIEGSVDKLPAGARATGVLAKVIGMQGDLTLINRGTAAGIKEGQQFTVVRPVDTGLKDPDTGQPVIRKKRVCDLSVTEVEDTNSSGKCIGEQPAAGDEVKPAEPKSGS
jgi:curli biogenesis system outer membrane secretion channel CsgG